MSRPNAVRAAPPPLAPPVAVVMTGSQKQRLSESTSIQQRR